MSQCSPMFLMETSPCQIAGETKIHYHGNRGSAPEMQSHLANVDKLLLDERGRSMVARSMRRAVNIRHLWDDRLRGKQKAARPLA